MYVEGAFDLVTEAHLDKLAEARRHADAVGDCLVVVGLLSGGGRFKGLLGAPERALMVLALRSVDDVVLHAGGGPPPAVCCGRYPIVAPFAFAEGEEDRAAAAIVQRVRRQERVYAARARGRRKDPNPSA